MDRKLGVYLCSGCGIGDALDVGALSGLATKQRDVAICRTDPFLCGVTAATALADDVREGRVERVIIGACSPRAQTAMFPAAGGVDPERVNLREHVAWCHEPRHEDTQALAEDYLRMALVRVRQTEPPQPLADSISDTLLVVGGGITGMSAALGAAEAGHPVVLVEQAPGLGGFVAGLRSRFPVSPPYAQLDRDGIDDLVAAVSAHPRIDVRTSTTVAATSGQPGMFDVTLASGASTNAVRAGAMVMATGWKPYDATKLGHLGYGLPNVVTNVEFERMAAAGPIARADGKPIASALMIQCAGSRDPDHLPYCSNVCCMASLKHTVYLHEQNPDTTVYIVYRDLRDTGTTGTVLPRGAGPPADLHGEGRGERRAGHRRRPAAGVGERQPAGRVGRTPGGSRRAGHRHGPVFRGRRSHPAPDRCKTSCGVGRVGDPAPGSRPEG